jgi:NDP-sugar pyrophosphorylase family protein
MADKIVDHLGDGQAFGIELHYTREPAPLGTAGALAMLEETADTLLVINSDILTDLDFRAFSQYHHDNRADITIAVRKYEVNVPYGVVESEGHVVQRLVEKPCLSFFINAGIYLLEPVTLNLIGKGERLDMTELIQRLIDRRRKVITFPIHEYWLDIGRFEDFEQAQRDAAEGKVTE